MRALKDVIQGINLDEYYQIKEYPNHISGAAVIARMLDGLGFRFYWATEELRPEDYTFRPAEDVMSIEELIIHIWQLMNWVSTGALKKSITKNQKQARKLGKRH